MVDHEDLAPCGTGHWLHPPRNRRLAALTRHSGRRPTCQMGFTVDQVFGPSHGAPEPPHLVFKVWVLIGFGCAAS